MSARHAGLRRLIEDFRAYCAEPAPRRRLLAAGRIPPRSPRSTHTTIEDTIMTNTTTRDRFATLADARTELTGTGSWEWAPGTSWDAWTEYAYRYAVETIDEMRDRHWDHDATLAAYLLSAGANPADFQLDPTDLRGDGPADEVLAMCERELVPADDSTDAPFEMRLQIDTAIEFGGGSWSWFVADLCDRDVKPGATNRWWVAYDGEHRAVVGHADSEGVTWTDAASPASALARVLTGTGRG